MISIFRQKTAPAFEVALQLGAIAAGADPQTRDVLTAFSAAIGIAYQIQDDIDDQATDAAVPDGRGHATSLLDALSREGIQPHSVILDRARQLRQHYADETIRCLAPLRNAPLKCLLFRIANLFVDPSKS